jgi:YVTN family beta-propeller protein
MLIALPDANTVSVIDLKTMKVARNIDVPAAPQEIVIRPDGKMAYVSCEGADQVAEIDLADWKINRTFHTGKGPDGLAWAQSE